MWFFIYFPKVTTTIPIIKMGKPNIFFGSIIANVSVVYNILALVSLFDYSVTMKLVIFLAFVALAASVPLKDASTQSLGYWAPSSVQGPQVQKVKKGKIQKEQSQVENIVPALSPLEVAQKALAHQAALQVLQGALQAKQTQYQTAAEQLQQEALIQQNFGVNVPQSALQQNQVAAAAIQQLGQTPNPQASSQLAQTLQVAFEAQLASNNVENQQNVQSGPNSQIPSQNPEVFQSKVQQLVTQNAIQDLQEEIDKKENSVQQLQQQRQFVNQQKQQIQAQIALGKQGPFPQEFLQLQQAEQILQQQEQYLLEQEIAGQIVIQKLHEALLEQQNQLQQDSLVEQVKEQQLSQLQGPQSNQWYLVNPQSQVVNPWFQPANQFSPLQQQQPQINYPWAQPANQWVPIGSVQSSSLQSVNALPQKINQPQVQANIPWFQPASQLNNQPAQANSPWFQPANVLPLSGSQQSQASNAWFQPANVLPLSGSQQPQASNPLFQPANVLPLSGSQQSQASNPWIQPANILPLSGSQQSQASNPWFQPTNVLSLSGSQPSPAGNPLIQSLNQGPSAAAAPIAPWFQIASQWTQLGQQLSLAKNQSQPLTSVKQNVIA